MKALIDKIFSFRYNHLLNLFIDTWACWIGFSWQFCRDYATPHRRPSRHRRDWYYRKECHDESE